MVGKRGIHTAFVAGVLGVCACSPLQLGVVRGRSMEPTLRNGQLMLVARHRPGHIPLRKGEVVLFRHYGVNYVKRVYALEGETIFLLAEGNQPPRAFLEPVRPEQANALRAMFARTPYMRVRRLRVPPGCFFALGDALSCSIDSRELGPISNDAVFGQVLPWPGPIPTHDAELALPEPRPDGMPRLML